MQFLPESLTDGSVALSVRLFHWDNLKRIFRSYLISLILLLSPVLNSFLYYCACRVGVRHHQNDHSPGEILYGPLQVVFSPLRYHTSVLSRQTVSPPRQGMISQFNLRYLLTFSPLSGRGNNPSLSETAKPAFHQVIGTRVNMKQLTALILLRGPAYNQTKVSYQ